MAVYNHLLFSELFFRQIRRDTADLDNLRATLGTIRDTWQYYLPTPENTANHSWQPPNPIDKDDVSQLRSYIIEPIFGYLELVYAPCDTDNRAFFLYGDWEQENRTGLCLVLPYSANIEGRDPSTGRIPKGRNYAQQLLHLLRENDLEWGVLTNGRFWRLYHRSELSPTDTYLQVDLGQIINTDNIQDYIVFHRFFSRPAFARENGRQRLEHYKEQSDKATKQIEDHLSTHVEEIVRYLSQGLVESCRANQEDITSRDTRTTIYQNALFLVYRLLFALYAEARDLLPLDNPTYADVCLRDLLNQVQHNHAHSLNYDDEYAMWDHLQALFALIDQGDAAADVPAYNGGLFDPGRRPFLTQHRIRNTYLQAALLRLAYLPAKGKTYDQDRQPLLIDYRDLSVRHLGSLYEGLLEYNLFVVRDEPRVVRATKKTTRYVPYSQAGKVRATETVLQIDEVYFSETEGERKATGSYYTPEDVVDYIVRNTVGEMLQERRHRFFEDQAIQHQLQDLVDTPTDIPAHAQIQRALDDQYLRFINRQILDLKVLDPAMGSGHFLVNTTHTIANFIVEFLNETHWENPDIDTDVAYWKRQVAERCIFGVDLNELAVELAKLCLWMTTTAKGKPLTFVDHHLRRGNSLVGAWFEDVGIYPFVKKESEQAFTLPLERYQLDLKEVLGVYQELYSKSQDDVDEVREKARLFDEEITPRLERYHELLSLHTGIFFGNNLNQSDYAKLGEAVKEASKWDRTKTESHKQLIRQIVDNRWFHWELEFPEAFQHPNTGFDAVVGNPPYVDVATDLYIDRHFACASSRNLYSYMMEQSTNVSRPSGAVIGLIVPMSLVCSGRMGVVRNWLKTNSSLIRLANFGIRPEKIFPRVDQRVTIVFIHTSDEDDPQPIIQATRFNRWHREHRAQMLKTLQFADIAKLPDALGWAKLGDETSRTIATKLLKTQDQISEILGSDWTFYYHGVGRYWLKGYDFIPLYRKKDVIGRSSTLGEMAAINETLGKVIVGIINSSLFFWYWILYSDDFHLQQQEIASFPFKYDAAFDDIYIDLGILVDKLMKDYQNNAVEKDLRVSGGAITIQEFYPRLSKSIIDQIDDLLGKLYGLTTEEINYIKNYDIEFRAD